MTQTQNDPWAAAGASQSSSATQHTQDNPSGDGSFQAGAVTDMSNPFATSEEVTPAGGGNFDPFVPNGALLGRPVVMVPRYFTDKDPKPEKFGGKPGEIRDRWTVDIVVLGGPGPLEFDYQTREEKDGPLIDKRYASAEFPQVFRGQRIYAGQIIAALNGANAAGKFVFGTFVRVPVREDERKGMTRQQLEQRLAKWREDMIKGVETPKPRHSFNLVSEPDVWTPKDVDAAMAWWEQEKASRLSTAS